jgi:osmotically-inducible protein OsmY
MSIATCTGTDPCVDDALIAIGLPSSIRADVADGHVTLTGRVPWPFHRVAAEVAVREVAGVTGVTNRIEVAPLASYRDVRTRIAEALGNTGGGARHITVAIRGCVVTLTGRLASAGLRAAVAEAVAAAPGVSRVENRIDVLPAA